MNSTINPEIMNYKKYFKKLQKRIDFREKESKKVPSFNQPRPKSNKV